MLLLKILNPDIKWRIKTKAPVFFLIVFALVCADLATKKWADTRLIEKYDPEKTYSTEQKIYRLPPDYEQYIFRDITVIPGFWTFSYVRNEDIGFSAMRWLDSFIPKKIKINLLRILQQIFFSQPIRNIVNSESVIPIPRPRRNAKIILERVRLASRQWSKERMLKIGEFAFSDKSESFP